MKKVVLLLFITISIATNAQRNYLKNMFVEPAYYYGSVLPQLDYIDYLLQDHIQGFHINIGRNTDGSKDWHKYLNYPRMGFGYYHSNLGNNKVFGYLNAFYGTVAIKTFNNRYRFNIEHNLTAGAGFVTTRYYLHYNSFNIAIGSPYNFFLQYSLLLPVRISPILEVYAGSSFTHISVANIIEPNNGINMGLLRVGCRYNIKAVDYIKSEEQKLKKRHFFTLVFATGRKQYSRMFTEKYWVYAISPEYCFKLNPAFGIGAGVDFYYDTFVKAYYKQKGLEADLNQIFHSTAHLTFQLYMGKLSFLVQPGCYVYKKFDFYQQSSYKFGFKYQFIDQLSASIMLKTHWLAQADVLEFGCGYSLYK